MKVVKNVSIITKFLFNFVQICKSEETRAAARKNIHSYIRNRNLKVFDLITFLMFRNNTTMNRDLAVFFSKSKRLSECVSKQAMSKALKKMNPYVFTKLFKDFRNLFYSSSLVKTFKGYVILSEDGTYLEIPHSIKNIMNYGFVENKYVSDMFDVKKVMAKGAGIYDVTNGFFLDFLIRPANYSELPMAVQHICRIKESLKGIPSIFLADRYYGSIELIALLMMNDMKYCIRAKSNFYKELVSKIEKDGWITIEIDEKWLNRFKYMEEIKEYVKSINNKISIRVVKHQYEYMDESNNKTTELIYFTNLSGYEFSTEEIIELYAKRWEIETSFKKLKITQEIERVNSSHQTVVECKMLAKILLFNITGLIESELNYELIKKKTEIYNEGYRANHDFLYQTVLEELYEGIVKRKFSFNKLKEILKGIIKAEKNKIVPIRHNRHYLRWGRFIKSGFYYRFRLDGRNDPKVKNYKGGLLTVSH